MTDLRQDPPPPIRAARARVLFGACEAQRDFALCALGGAVLIALLAKALAPGIEALAVLALYAVAATAIVTRLPHDLPYPALGWCNVVTAFRGVLVAFLAVPLLTGTGTPWLVPAVALLALSLDGVDGWLARTRGMTSRFGARFDLEVDAALACILALHAAHGVSAALVPAMLVLGFLRYVFVAAALLLPWLGRDLPDRFSRKAACVVQLSALIVLQVPVLPHVAIGPVALGAAAILSASFGRDVLWLWQRR
ncbi:CDP-alcohol phosphatidyltransferase family protein [Roseivivax isoporae]|uniref:CDP-alcohol phosphatidyltransferase n=1 Tax=Roseivivax isoporae LMG 25204 TaxID=1449351 RepID=X7F865_9RHOB|nr:CDP-alcohol phosphatidyltransferase family protein [Roseivivax isoporae]ETX28923.1 hypothetical protein RISW2_04210 [Roseivivax isoporae LMG 25204]